MDLDTNNEVETTEMTSTAVTTTTTTISITKSTKSKKTNPQAAVAEATPLTDPESNRWREVHKGNEKKPYAARAQGSFNKCPTRGNSKTKE